MATELLALGDTAESSDWTTLDTDEAHTLIVFGAVGASVLIEAKYGSGDEDAVVVGGLSGSSAMRRIQGPLTYRVRRENGISSGCVAETGSAPA